MILTEEFLQVEQRFTQLDARPHRMMQAVLAMSKKGIIGRGADEIPWRCSPDMRRFKALTIGNVLVLGYRTYIGMVKNWSKEHVLPGRDIVVLSFTDDASNAGIMKAHTSVHTACLTAGKKRSELDRTLSIPMMKLSLIGHDAYRRMINAAIGEIIEFAQGKPIFLGGGGNTYGMFSAFIDKYDVTVVDVEPEGDDLVSLIGLPRLHLIGAGLLSDPWSHLDPPDNRVDVHQLAQAHDDKSGVGCKFYTVHPLS